MTSQTNDTRVIPIKVKNIALPFPEFDYELIKAAAKKDSRSMGAFLLVAAREYIRNHNL